MSENTKSRRAAPALIVVSPPGESVPIVSSGTRTPGGCRCHFAGALSLSDTLVNVSFSELPRAVNAPMITTGYDGGEQAVFDRGRTFFVTGKLFGCLDKTFHVELLLSDKNLLTHPMWTTAALCIGISQSVEPILRAVPIQKNPYDYVTPE